MSLIRYIFLFAIGYFVWRMLDNFFSKNKDEKRRSQRRANEGVKVKKKPVDKSHIPDDEGDYIDYEDMK